MDITTTELTVKDDLTEDKYNLITGFEKKLQKHLRKKAALDPLFEDHNPYGKYKPEPLFIDPQGKYLLAHVDGVPAGFAYYNPATDFYDNSLFIGELFVKKQYRQQGIGKALLEHLEQTARSLKRQGLSLCSLTPNKKALDFYKDYGFNNFVAHDYIMSRDSLNLKPFDYSVTKAGPFLQNKYTSVFMKDVFFKHGEGHVSSEAGVKRNKRQWLTHTQVYEVKIDGVNFYALGNPKNGRLVHIFNCATVIDYAKIVYAMSNKKSGLCAAMVFSDTEDKYYKAIEGSHLYFEVLYKGL